MNIEELKVILENCRFNRQYISAKKRDLDTVSHFLQNNGYDNIFNQKQKQIEDVLQEMMGIEEAIQFLKQPYKTVIYMRYIDNFTMEQIADKLNYSCPRIYQLHSTGLKNLLDIVNERDIDIVL